MTRHRAKLIRRGLVLLHCQQRLMTPDCYHVLQEMIKELADGKTVTVTVDIGLSVKYVKNGKIGQKDSR